MASHHVYRVIDHPIVLIIRLFLSFLSSDNSIGRIIAIFIILFFRPFHFDHPIAKLSSNCLIFSPLGILLLWFSLSWSFSCSDNLIVLIILLFWSVYCSDNPWCIFLCSDYPIVKLLPVLPLSLHPEETVEEDSEHEMVNEASLSLRVYLIHSYSEFPPPPPPKLLSKH